MRSIKKGLNLPNKTQIFNSFKDFQNREYKSINGVSNYFASEYPDWEKMNETNLGCWECLNCRNCKDCNECVNCTNCYDCVDCRWCINCRKCELCSSCWNCIGCYDCEICCFCFDCKGCIKCKSIDNETQAGAAKARMVRR
jgi:hypothetical protein